MAEYKLSYTAQEIDNRLGKISEIENSLDGKQDKLAFDLEPIEGSENLITSGAIYAALANNSTDDEKIMDLMTEMELIDPVTLSDGSILVSNNNEIYTI